MGKQQDAASGREDGVVEGGGAGPTLDVDVEAAARLLDGDEEGSSAEAEAAALAAFESAQKKNIGPKPGEVIKGDPDDDDGEEEDDDDDLPLAAKAKDDAEGKASSPASRGKAAADDKASAGERSVGSRETSRDAPDTGAEARQRKLEGQFGALKDQVTQLSTQIARLVNLSTGSAGKAGTDRPTDQEVKGAQTLEAWEKLKGDYPDWADALDQRISADAQAHHRQLLQQAEAIARAQEDMRVTAALGDWDWEATLKEQAFVSWVDSVKDDANMAKLLAEPGARAAIKVFRAYKASDFAKNDPNLFPDGPGGVEDEEQSRNNAAAPRRVRSERSLQAAAPVSRGGGRRVAREETAEEAAQRAFAANARR